MFARPLDSKIWGYLVAVIGIAAVTTLLRLAGPAINPTTVALAMLLIVLFVAAAWGARPAIASSLLAVLCFNYFFLPPVGRLTIGDPDNWIALGAFLVTAITAGQLSAGVRRRAEEAEAGRREIQRLYEELQSAFERASHAEALRQSERLKSALLDAVTHDLRTPLTSIKASVTTMLNELEAKGRGQESTALNDESRREMLEVIDEECDRLNRFIEGLVEMARIEAGELRLRRRWGTIDEIVTASLERARKIVGLRPIAVRIEENLPAVRVDARAVSEVIYSLVENAAKYSPPGALIRLAATHESNDAIRIIVEDRGQGVPVELRDRVFDKFFRATHGVAEKKQPSGTGMGLAIARGIVEAHGGRIWIENGDDGVGARFIFTLPIGDDEESSDVKLAAKELESGLATRG
jgi:K+-sensing histidine kinase KdpD